MVSIIKLASYAASDPTGNGGVIAVETIGTGLIILVYLFGYIGGAHFNPSVSLGVFISQPQDFTIIDFLSYFFAQIIGGLLGGFFCWGIGGKAVGQVRVDYDSHRFDASQAFLAEVLFTFNLVNCVLNVATSAIKKNNFYGIAIGSSVGTAVCAVGINGISGACLNFAVYFGTTMSAIAAGTSTSDIEWGHLALYLFAPLIGAAFAGLLFRFLYQDYDLDSEVEYAGERTKHQLRRYVAEFLGTAYLVLIVKLVSAQYDPGELPYNSITSAAIGVGFGLISLVYQYGYIC